METSESSLENFLKFNFNLKYNMKNINFSIFDIGNNEMKLLAKEPDNNKLKIIKNYEARLKFVELKKKYKYFKMFESYEESKSNFIELCKRKNIQINYIDENEIILLIDFNTITDNLMNISLKRIEMSDKEKNLLLKDLNYKNEKIDELNLEINIIKKELKIKDDKIVDLEKCINNLIIRIDNLEKRNMNKLKDLNEKQEINALIYKNVIENSNIINNEKEINFLINAISPSKTLFFNLLYSSELYGENREKLKNAYIAKNDILVIIKTKKNKRFGGYAHESFEDKEFEKQDKKAFLFNLDNLKIYKSKGTKHTIWNNQLNSIDLGYGTDLRIFYNFFSEKNYTNQSDSDFEYNDELFALNGEKYFDILYLELYKVFI